MPPLDTRHVYLLSSLPPDQLLLQRVRGYEELGRLFQFDLELLSPDPELKIDDLLGDKMTVVLDAMGEPRYFNGIVTAFGHAGKHGRFERYFCTLRPFLWLMSHGSDCKIFPKMSVPDIVAKVIADHGAGGLITRKLQRTYGEREYTVQYRESHLAFISRLMEEEGIYYHFDHTKDQHKLVICDDKASHENKGEIPYMDPAGGASARRDFLREWEQQKHVRPGAFVINDFDFFSPSADLAEVRKSPLKHKHANFEHYEPFSRFVQWGTDASAKLPARQIVETRLEEAQADHERIKTQGNVRALAIGDKFDLVEHPRADQDQEYLVIRTEFAMFQPGYDAGSSSSADGEKEELFDVQAQVQPSKQPFRPARVTPKPVMAGPHTAVVVTGGTSTDAQGRVKVQFPWDRLKASSCWVRVSSPWAGSGFGGLHVPREGQEVIVEFIEGDPDKPIVTGRVYNGTNLPPFGLPGGATKSGFLTRSMPDGSAATANELRLDDKKGDEQFFIHAEKNMDTEVEKDQTLWVGQNRTNTIDKDQTEHVKGNKKITVDKEHTEKIVGNMTETIVGSQTQNVGGSRTMSVSGSHSETIGTTQNITVAAAQGVSVGGAAAMTVGAAYAIDVGAAMNVSVGAALSISVAANGTVSAGEDLTITVGKKGVVSIGETLAAEVKKDISVSTDENINIAAKKKFILKAEEIVIEAEKKLTLKAGDATIVLDNGKIEIKGSKIQGKSDGDLILKGSKITQN
jgi:type VI secretion system secreted protein VgrG